MIRTTMVLEIVISVTLVEALGKSILVYLTKTCVIYDDWSSRELGYD